jgi:uncharacterized repeat protein (TIGR01451 family)
VFDTWLGSRRADSATTASRPSRRFRPEVEPLEERWVPALIVTKTASAAQVQIGTPVTYTVTVANTSGSNITGLTITDSYSAGSGLLFTSASASGGSSSISSDGLTATISGLTITGLGSVTATFVAQANAAGSFTNTVVATGLEGGEVNRTGSTALSVTVTAPAPPVQGRIPIQSTDDQQEGFHLPGREARIRARKARRAYWLARHHAAGN